MSAVDAHPFGAVSQHAFDGTLPALTTDPVTDEAVTRIVAGPTRRAAPVRPQPRARALPTATDDAPTDPAGVGATGPFVAVSIVPPRPRSKMRLVSVVALGCVVALAGVYLAVKVSDEGAHTASAPPITAPPITAPPSAPRPAPVAPQTPTAPGGTSERLKIDEVAQLDAGSTADAAAPPLALGTVSILAVPWGTVSVDGQPPRDSGAIFHLPAGRHRVRAVIQSRYVVTRTVTIHVGANPNVRLDAPVDYAM